MAFTARALCAQSYNDADLYAADIDNKKLADKIAALPLAEQPGIVWTMVIPPTSSAG